MPAYLYTARTPRGRRRTAFIDADTLDHARKVLVDEGCTEIVFYTDDASLAAVPRLGSRNRRFSARDMVAMMTLSPVRRFLWFLAKAYRAGWLCIFIAIGLFVLQRRLGGPLGLLDAVAIGILSLPFFVTVIVFVSLRASRYHRVTEAASWARWRDVLRLLPTLPARVPEHEKAFLEA